jgi:hypothetical protein
MAAPANDQFANAQVLPGTAATTTNGTTVAASTQAGEPDHGAFDPVISVWYRWTAPSSGTILVDACDGPDGVVSSVAFYTGGSLSGLSMIGNGNCIGFFKAAADTTYRIAVGSDPGYPGQFPLSLELLDPPANDDLGNAQQLPSSDSSTTPGTMYGSSRESGEGGYNFSDELRTSSVWFRWTAPSSGTGRLRACGPPYSVSQIVVFTGETIGDLQEVGNGQGNCGANFAATAGQTYKIALVGFAGDWDSFSLVLDMLERPANDDFADAAVLSGRPPLSTTGTTLGATEQYGEGFGLLVGNTSVWYSWTSPINGTIRASSSCEPQGERNHDVAVFTGDDVETLNDLSWDTCSTSFRAVAGRTYRIMVSNSTFGGGPFQLDLAGIPDEPRLGKVVVRGPARMKSGRAGIFRVTISNPNNIDVTGVRLAVSGRGVKARSLIGRIRAGTARTVRIKVRPIWTGRTFATFKVGSANAGSRSTKKRIDVRR